MLEPILKTQLGKVSLTYPTMPDFNLQMDFNPIIERFRLQGNFCLLHWQAKPFGERRWGVYDFGRDYYASIKYCELDIQVLPQPLQIDEKLIKTVPTALLFFPNSQLIKNGYYSINSL